MVNGADSGVDEVPSALADSELCVAPSTENEVGQAPWCWCEVGVVNGADGGVDTAPSADNELDAKPPADGVPGADPPLDSEAVAVPFADGGPAAAPPVNSELFTALW